MINLTLNKHELLLIDQILNVPLYAFGLEQLLEKTRLEKDSIVELQNIFQIPIKTAIDAADSEIAISEQNLKDFLNVYDVSCEIIDPTEMHTLTGYEWEKSQELSKKLSQNLAGFEENSR
jgi:hypothetical protein